MTLMGTDSAPTNCILVLVLDAHPAVRGAVGTVVEASDDMELVGTAASRAEAMRLCASRRPDVILVGITLRGSTGIQAIASFRRHWPETRLLAMGSFLEEEQLQPAIEAGAVGSMLKNVSAEELGRAIRAAYASRRGTTARPSPVGPAERTCG